MLHERQFESLTRVLIYYFDNPAQKHAPIHMQKHKNKFPAAHTNTHLLEW